MAWVKNVLLDIVCTALIAVYVLAHVKTGGVEAGSPAPGWVASVRWFIVIYTPFMLVLKLAALAVGPRSLRGVGAKKKLDAQAPPGFFHAVYGLNVALLLWGRLWLLAAGWAAIWILSAIFEMRMRPSK